MDTYIGFDGVRWQKVKRLDFEGDGRIVYWYPDDHFPYIFYADCQTYPLVRIERNDTLITNQKASKVFETGAIEYTHVDSDKECNNCRSFYSGMLCRFCQYHSNWEPKAD
jgi:hypothetical protein